MSKPTANSSASTAKVTGPPTPLAVFCDGTWCGRETGTSSNIQMLAEMVGRINFNPEPDEEPERHATRVNSISAKTVYVPVQNGHRDTNVPVQPIAGYQEGIGLNKTFLEYLWDGATASTIAEECTAVYKYIVENFYQGMEIWMFGLSRGAYTARCVAGMINNCGILKIGNRPGLSDGEIWTLCYEVYRTYRSPLEVDQPQSDKSKFFRSNSSHVWQVKRPIKFMGLFDTVGSLGIPRVNAGVGFDWPEFYDHKVSSVVQHMYHAVSLHDRLWIFQPCLAFEGEGPDRARIYQKWFPGCHYDLGRQAFRFFRKGPRNLLEQKIGVLPDLLSKTIQPNEVLGDCVLRWMLQCISEHDPWRVLIPNIDDKIRNLENRLINPALNRVSVGSGDVYDNVLEYAPAGSLLSMLQKFGSHAIDGLNEIWPKLGENVQDLLGIKVILRILAATADRRIPGGYADVYNYKTGEKVGQLEFNISSHAQVLAKNKEGKERYPSRTLENWHLWERMFGTHSRLLMLEATKDTATAKSATPREKLNNDLQKTGHLDGVWEEDESRETFMPTSFEDPQRVAAGIVDQPEASRGNLQPADLLNMVVLRGQSHDLQRLVRNLDIKGVTVQALERAVDHVLLQEKDGREKP